MRNYRLLSVALAALLVMIVGTRPAQAALDTSHLDTDQSTGATVDGTIGASEYNGYTYTGSGGGFGGPLGNGTLHFESDASNLYVGANIAGDLGGNLITLYLDTRAGGFGDDSGMNDTSDGGRSVVSNLTLDVQDTFPIEADFALQFGAGFTNLFELQPNDTVGGHIFIAPSSSGSGGSGGAGDREVSVPLSTLGLLPGDTVSFFATLISGTNFTSDEGIPGTGFSGNPGFNPGSTVTWPNHSQFVVAIPEPSALLFGGLACGVLGVKLARKPRPAAKSA